MKKSLLAAFVVAGLFATSCKKERTCKCTSTVTGGTPVVTEYTIKETKKKAEDACEGYEASSSAGGITATVSCELD